MTLVHSGDTDLATPIPTPKRHTRRIVLWVLAGFVVLLLAFAGWVAYRSVQAYHALSAARQTLVLDAPGDFTQLSDGTVAATQAMLAELGTHSAAAVDAMDDPLVRLAAHLPWVGDDLRAVTEVANTVDGLARTVGPDMLGALTNLEPSRLAPSDGSIDVSAILAAGTQLQSADATIASDIARLTQIDRSTLVSSVGHAVDDLSDKLTSVRAFTEPGAKVAAVLPPFLGADSPRRYLVVFQNLAELRSTGGIFGSYAVLSVDDGKLTISDQGSSSRTIGFQPAPVVPETPEQIALYGANIATIPMDVNFTPDFPYSARSFTAMYQATVDPAAFDGVISVDPVALAGILRGFDPISYQGVALTPDTLVKALLSDAYATYGQDATGRDAFLEGATDAAFTAMTTRPSDVSALIAGVRAGVDQRRILMYSFHPKEQALLRTLGITGELPAADEPTAPTFGVFLNDRTYWGSKLGYYQSGAVTVTAGSCQTDGTREVTVAADLRFDGPSDGLVNYVRGHDAYILRTELRSYAPTGATLTKVELNGVDTPFEAGTDLGRNAAKFTFDQQPSSTTAVLLHYTLPASGATGAVQPNVLLTPGVNPWTVTAPAFAGCAG